LSTIKFAIFFFLHIPGKRHWRC